jgi:transposase InsO family protein
MMCFPIQALVHQPKQVPLQGEDRTVRGCVSLQWHLGGCHPVTLGRAAKRGIRIDFIQPGQPQQNANVERYNRTVRYDWLAHYLFETLDEIQDFATRWLWTYKNDRPNMALNGITPKQKLALAA